MEKTILPNRKKTMEFLTKIKEKILDIYYQEFEYLDKKEKIKRAIISIIGIVIVISIITSIA